MAAGGASATKTKNPNPNPPSSLNPNWQTLQQKLKTGHPPKSKPHLSDTKALTKPPPPSSVLGKRKEAPGPSPPPSSSVLIPTSDDFSLTEALAMDCEMVGVSSQGNKSALARVTVVNTWGNVVYDEYVRPLERIVDFRTNISGINPKNMRKAKEFMTVQQKVAEMIKGRILVGHALHNDLKVLLLSHQKKDIRDTALYQPLLRDGRKRALKDLADQILGVKIQQKEHCPVEDARAAMLIYKKYKKNWEKSIKELVKFREKRKNKSKKKSMEKDAGKSDVLSIS
ncbi:putative RNA exonuclease 4 [Iris pallida]|uniref:RNA exonuclease 4 n=1 Tax=Iris pallida TaxID=29817 RepID=A0AAX6GED3_IRIPA|nr:putative RNA exonuclease 4 [Iris pallida]